MSQGIPATSDEFEKVVPDRSVPPRAAGGVTGSLEEREEQLRRKNEWLSLLTDAAADLLRATDPDAMLRDLFEKVKDRLGLDVFFNFMVDPTGRGLVLDVCGGVDEAAARSVAKLQMGQIVCGTVAMRRERIVLRGIQQGNGCIVDGEDKADGVRAMGVRAYACHPLMVGDRLIGPLSFGSRRRDHFEEDELAFMQTVCHYVAMAKERLRSSAAVAEIRRKLDAALIAGEVGTFEWDVGTDRLWGDANFERLFGIVLDAGGGAPLAAYLAAIHPADRALVMERVQQTVETGRNYQVEYRIKTGGLPRWVIARGKLERDAAGRPAKFPGVVLDVTDRKEAELLLAAQNRALELVGTGAPLSEALGALTRVVEEQCDGQAIAAILLVDADGCTLRTGAAHGLPSEYNAAIDGIKAKKDLGTCADAAARNEVVITPDLEAAPSWKGLSHLPLGLGLKAAWSMPIRGSDGRVLGTFGTYFRECREPTERERRMVASLCRAAAVVLEQRRGTDALRESEMRFERQSRLFEQIAATTPDFIYVFGLDGRFLYANRRLLEVWGRSFEDAVGKNLYELGYPQWHADMHMRELAQVIETKRPIQGEVPFTGGSGISGVYEYIFTPVLGPDGNVEVIAGTTRDVTHRKQLLAAEREARVEAERAGQMKDEFLATLSHELRTPLNAILGWSQILARGEANRADLDEGLRTIERNARAQRQIIEDLLDMSRIISGKVRLDVQAVDVASVVQEAVATAQPSAEAKGIRLQVVLDHDCGQISGDPGRLQQVFWNLLSNAVKFTPRGGRVRVSVERVGAQVEVGVSDTGEGIGPEFLPHVFDRFRQADASTTRRHGGLGLGLSIVKQLVELHGGSIRAASAGVGQGATFTVSLPESAAPTEPRRQARPEHPHRAVAPSDGATGAVAPIAGLRVLVVDDEPDARALIKRLLEDHDAEVLTAGSAAEALELVRTSRPHMIASDIGMPGEDGYALIRRVRALGADAGGQLPAIALTAYARAEDRVKAMLAGFDVHVPKPIEPAELLAVVAALAARTR